METELFKLWITSYGPLGLGWPISVLLGYLLYRTLTKEPPEKTEIRCGTAQAYENLLELSHRAIVANSEAMARLSTIIEERTKKV